MAGSMLPFSIEILQLSSLYHSYPLFYLNKARVAGGIRTGWDTCFLFATWG